MLSELKQRAAHRTKIIQGQLRGVEKMIENEEYCMDIITQSLAIQKSLSSLNKLLVENHLRIHIAKKLSSSDAKIQSEAIREMLDLYELTHVRSTR